MSEGNDASNHQRIEQEAADWLARLRGGDPADRAAFEDWYCADPLHADTYDRVLASWQASQGLAPVLSSRAPRRRPWRFAAAAIAAVIVFALLGFALLGAAPRLPAERPLVFESRAGEIRTLALSDGSRVTLDTATAIRASYTHAERRVWVERGRARFDVAPEVRPFVVATKAGAVVAAGGSLDVGVAGEGTSVALLHGSAELRGGRQNASWTRLTPGQVLSFGPAGKDAASRPLGAAESRWTAGMISFEDAPLAEVVAAANRYGGARIVLADTSLAALRFTGTFKATDHAALARMVAAMFRLDCDASSEGRLILSRPAKR